MRYKRMKLDCSPHTIQNDVISDIIKDITKQKEMDPKNWARENVVPAEAITSQSLLMPAT